MVVVYRKASINISVVEENEDDSITLLWLEWMKCLIFVIKSIFPELVIKLISNDRNLF